MNALDHPCKQTCSGWKQGYEKGLQEIQAQLAESKRALAAADEALDFNVKQVQQEAPLWVKLNEKLRIATEVLEMISRRRALTIFIEETPHVTDFFKPVDEALAKLNTPASELPDTTRREHDPRWKFNIWFKAYSANYGGTGLMEPDVIAFQAWQAALTAQTEKDSSKCKHLSQIDTLPPFCAVCGIELSEEAPNHEKPI